jgi:diguanylate cyclase (GGDEF)-like protein
VTLFARAFLLIALLIVTAVLASFQIYRIYEREPRSRELAQQTVSTINLTRAALVNADPVLRRDLLIELNETEGLRLIPAAPGESVEPLPDDPLLERVAERVRAALGDRTRFGTARDGEEGFWVSFFIAGDEYWVMLPRERFTPVFGLRWLGWLALLLALALVGALLIASNIAGPLAAMRRAARRLGRGDFSVQVPAEGNDEFAALGKEFNSMALQLEARLEDLRRERGRLQEAIRRVGESFARGLDRVGVLDIVVQTAVDGVGASCGRATMRRRADAPMEEVTRSGEPEAFHRALHAAEAAVMDAGEVAEIQIGGASAMAAPLSATEAGDRVLAIVSVARGDRPFAPAERELFAYLTSQAAVSVENVDLHETVQRQAVTDELTGLFNHRRFQEVMSAEVERARRYDAEMGLIMLDIDNFKRVNDTYGHMQGDMVLREVARVLRQSAREIDEPARYGGEEMAVALPQTDLDGAFRFAERVRQRIEALELPLLDGDGILRVTASFGAASLSSASQSDKEGLVAAADAALYRAKRSGKNRTVKAE